MTLPLTPSVQSPAAYRVGYASAAAARRVTLREYLEDDGYYNVMGFIPQALKAAIRAGTSTEDVLAYLQEALDAAAADGVAGVRVRGGLFNIDGNLIVPAKMSLIGCGLGKSIIQHVATSGRAISLPLYGSNEAAVEYGGNVMKDFTLQGAGASNATVGLYIKNKTDVQLSHLEIDSFEQGIGGARDDAMNSVNALTCLGLRVRNCKIALYGPNAWNGCHFIGGQYHGEDWSIVLYDAVRTTIETTTQNSGQGAIYLGGCVSCTVNTYCEGDSENDAFIIVRGGKDVDGNASVNDIAIGASRANVIAGCHGSSPTGIPYLVLLDGGSGEHVSGNNAGSGVSAACVRVADGTVRCEFGHNYCNAGVNVSYETAADQNTNFEVDFDAGLYATLRKLNVAGGVPGSLSGGLVGYASGSEAHLFVDNNTASDTVALRINAAGYQGGTSRYRRFEIYDGKGNMIAQWAAESDQLTLANSLNRMPNLRATVPTSGSKELYYDPADGNTVKFMP